MIGRALDQRHRLLAIFLGHLAGGDLTGEVAVDRGKAGLDAFGDRS